MAHKRKAKSVLTITSVENLQRASDNAVRAMRGKPCIYVSLDKSQKSAEQALKRSGVNTKHVCFIDCVTEGSAADSLHVPPTQLSKLAYAISCFVKEIRGEKALVVDALSTLLIYNNPNKVASFMRTVTEICSQNDVPLAALTPKTKGEELLNKIFHFFDEVKGR